MSKILVLSKTNNYQPFQKKDKSIFSNPNHSNTVASNAPKYFKYQDEELVHANQDEVLVARCNFNRTVVANGEDLKNWHFRFPQATVHLIIS